MKKKLMVLFILLFSSYAKGQDLKSVNYIFKQYAHNNRVITILNNIGGSESILAEKAGAVLKLQLEGDLLNDTLLNVAEKNILLKNFDALNEYYSSIKNIGDQSAIFRVVKNNTKGFIYPILNIGLFKEDTTLIQGGIYYDYSLNKLRTTEEERINQVLKKIAVPYIYNIKNLIAINDFKNFGVVCGFATKDFSDKFDFGITESVLVIFKVKDLKSFYDAEITDTELLKLSNILYTNQNMDSNVKKIEFN